MKVAIATDSNSGIFPQEAEKMGIYVVPMPIVIDGLDYYEGISITQEEFLKVLSAGRDVSTSQPSPASVTDTWDRALETHDQVLYIPMTGGLSGSCAAAQGLSRDYAGRVEVADNRRVSVTQRTAVNHALALAEQGKNAAEIREILEADGLNSSIFVAVDTLEYLRKGGRITAAAASLATVLGIKPVLTIQGEQVDSYAKVRGIRKAEKCMIEAMQKELSTRFADVSGRKTVLATAGSFADPAMETVWLDMVRQAFPNMEVFYDPLPLSLTCHMGPNAFGIGVAFL